MNSNNEKLTPFQEGIVLAVDKPLGWTSFDVVNKFRYRLCKALQVRKFKVGHAGTLDPLATGVVVLCTGRATKQIEALQASKKTYITTLKLGETTPSFDLETGVDKTYPTHHLTEELIRHTLTSFVGEQLQVPPSFSACKVDGQRAYEQARKGLEVTLAAKPITIYSVRLLCCQLPYIQVEIECGKGTYIRAFARDLGERLNCGAHLTELRRTQSGNYSVNNAITPDHFEDFIKQTLETATTK